MKTITIESEYQFSFDLYGLELITACGVVQCACVYLKRERAEQMGRHYLNIGWKNPYDGIEYSVYKANIVELTAIV